MTFLELLVAALTILGAYVAYLFKIKWAARKQLSWVRPVPGLPFVGNLLDFGGPTKILQDITRMLNNEEKLVYIEVGFTWGLVASNYEFMEFILSSNEILDKSSDYEAIKPWLSTGLLISTGQKWRKRRKIITPAFHFSILEQFVDVFDLNATILVKNLKKLPPNETFDVYPYMTALTLDAICETAMGVNTNSQSGQNEDYVNAVKGFSTIANARMFSLFHDNFTFKFTKNYWKMRDYLKVIHGFSNKVIEARKRELQNQPNPASLEQNNKTEVEGKKKKLALLDVLLNTTIDGQPLSQEDIREEVDTFMFAGHDTTSSSMASTLYLLSKHPDIQTLVRNEQKNIFGEDRDRPTTYRDLQEMKYLENVLKESLRLYPPVATVARTVTHDIEYKGHCIPKDTTISLFIYGINRDKDIYENPDEFQPDRFLDTNTLSRFPYAFIPFSAGPRNCMGQKYAMLEMKSVISKVVRNFELITSNQELILSSELILKSTNGVPIKLRPYDWQK
ncbi:hypothetical protein ABEB36_012048 [Hypothenemus hampei]|uniref:Cytochrome P450 n=1 Tax=Hypothenemus hampei TaxID=57062 RepID=A0ABD1EA58_HYPHA